MSRIRLVIVDKHPVVRLGLRYLLEQATGFEIVGEAATADTAQHLVQRLAPDVLLLGMNLPAEQSIALARHVAEAHVQTRLLVLSVLEEEHYVFEMLACGVAGYLTKEEPPEAIRAAIRGVAAGEIGWLSQRVASRLMQARGTSTPHELTLSRREREVLRLVAQGYSNRGVAEVLHLSVDTVRNHMTNIYAKLEARTRVEAVAWAWRHQLVGFN